MTARVLLGPQRKKKAMKMQHLSVHDIPKPVQIRNINLEQKQRSNVTVYKSVTTRLCRIFMSNVLVPWHEAKQQIDM